MNIRKQSCREVLASAALIPKLESKYLVNKFALKLYQFTKNMFQGNGLENIQVIEIELFCIFMNIYFLEKIYFINLIGKVTERRREERRRERKKKEWERERVHFPSDHNDWGRARLHLGAKNFIQISKVSAWNLECEMPSALFTAASVGSWIGSGAEHKTAFTWHVDIGREGFIQHQPWHYSL